MGDLNIYRQAKIRTKRGKDNKRSRRRQWVAMYDKGANKSYYTFSNTLGYNAYQSPGPVQEMWNLWSRNERSLSIMQRNGREGSKSLAENNTFRQMKNVDREQLNQNLLNAPWHVWDMFDFIDDKCEFWNDLFENIVDEHASLKRKSAWKWHSIYDSRMEKDYTR